MSYRQYRVQKTKSQHQPEVKTGGTVLQQNERLKKTRSWNSFWRINYLLLCRTR